MTKRELEKRIEWLERLAKSTPQGAAAFTSAEHERFMRTKRARKSSTKAK